MPLSSHYRVGHVGRAGAGRASPECGRRTEGRRRPSPPAGSLDEAPAADDPIFRHGGENLRAKLERIKKAREDKTVKALFLEIDGIEHRLGQARRAAPRHRRLPQARARRSSPISKGESKDYLLALACDEVAMPESAWLMLTGMRAEVSFYKGLFDKLGVKADMLQMGEFKGAAEPYTRTDMSPQFKKNLEGILDDYYEKGLDRQRRRGTPRQGADRGEGQEADRPGAVQREVGGPARADRPRRLRRRLQELVQDHSEERRRQDRQGLRKGEGEGRQPRPTPSSC